MAEPIDRLLMLIDDEPAQCRLISALAAREGWRTIIARDSETAIATLGTRQGMQLDAIVLDQWVPGDNACALIAELKARRPALPILMITTSASPLLAVEAMRAGASDYLIKPVAPDRLLQALRAATKREESPDELQPLTEKFTGTLDFDSMIGAAPSFRLDVRLIVCSNAMLGDLTDVQLFDPDLLEALSAVHVNVPALRERAGDIPALARHFLTKIGEQPGLRPLGITDGALALLGAYDWPGNVRQLQATLFRAAVFCDGEALTAQDFPNLSSILGEAPRSAPVQSEGAGVTLYAADGNLRPLEDIEADVIRLAIGHYRGRMTEVARRLGIGRSTLYRKLSELGIDNVA